jgi:hypothetical protein
MLVEMCQAGAEVRGYGWCEFGIGIRMIDELTRSSMGRAVMTITDETGYCAQQRFNLMMKMQKNFYSAGLLRLRC